MEVLDGGETCKRRKVRFDLLLVALSSLLLDFPLPFPFHPPFLDGKSVEKMTAASVDYSEGEILTPDLSEQRLDQTRRDFSPFPHQSCSTLEKLKYKSVRLTLDYDINFQSPRIFST